MRDVSFCQATNWVDTTYLHLHTYFHNPQKKEVWIVDPWHVQQVEPQTLIMEKIIMEKIIMEKPVNLP